MTMDCKQVRELIGALCAGDLDQGTANQVENHVAGCPGCEREKHQMARVVDAFGALESVGARADFSARLWERIDAWEAGRRVFWLAALAGFMRRHRRVVVTASVVFAVSLFTSIFVLHQMAGGPDVRMAGPGLSAESVSEGFVIREIPEADDVAPDSVYMHFVTGDRPVYRNRPQETYVYRPVVRPVSANAVTF